MNNIGILGNSKKNLTLKQYIEREENMEKKKIVIVEGPQGTGKTTLTNYLRDNMASSNLFRLSGQKDKTNEGKKKSILMYKALMNYLKEMQNVPMDIIFDRTFFTEEVYAKLGYKDYSFTDVYNELLEEITSLNYDIYFFCLYLQNIELYRERLDRESHHNYQAFSLDNSVNQQKLYLDIADDLENTNIEVHRLAMDDFSKSYNEVDKILKLKKGE